jgi:signal transduction histidine kinase
MSVGIQAGKQGAARFRAKLLAAMMLIVASLAALGLFLAQRKIMADAQEDLRQNFEAELTSLHKLEDLRHAALEERCARLASKPRIHAALEDNAIDLLYPSAKDELRDLMEGEEPPPGQAAQSLHAKFYRFLDGTGAVLRPPIPKNIGELDPKAEAQLALKELPRTQEIGFIPEKTDGGNGLVDEVIAVPIFSTDTGDVISALVIGFKPLEFEGKGTSAGMKSGIWVNGQLYLPSLPKSAQSFLGDEIANALAKSDRTRNNFRVSIEGGPHLLFYTRLNPASLFPPAYEICIYPLAYSMAQLHRLRWQIGGAGALLLLGGFIASNFVAARLSAPVAKLAVDSERDRAQRKRAEAALASTSEELERSARYSADASHQLKSPVTILRAGLEALMTREDFNPEVYHELSALLHQTHRLTGVIDDLLLLSRIDAGHLQIESEPVNLSELVEGWLDDLAALPDSFDVEIERKFPPELYVAGEKQYISLIVQNLLENSRKYNRPEGRIRVAGHKDTHEIVLNIGNTGRPIRREAQEHIFERFHRGSGGTAVSGHGLGLNLARELARLHGGDLRLVGSGNDWTEFEVRLRVAQQATGDVAKIV